MRFSGLVLFTLKHLQEKKKIETPHAGSRVHLKSLAQGLIQSFAGWSKRFTQHLNKILSFYDSFMTVSHSAVCKRRLNYSNFDPCELECR